MIWLFAGLFLGISRFVMPSHGIHTEDIFKDIAHLYVGGLFGAWFATKRKDYRNAAFLMTALEVIAFFTKSQ
jgi:hypothetical protein